MATYKLTFNFIGGGSATATPTYKPENIEDFTDELTGAEFQCYNERSGKSMVVNMKNVTAVMVERVED